MDIALRCPRRVQRRNSFDCRCRSDILSARYCAGGDGAARRHYHRAKHVQRFIAGFGRAGGTSPGGTKERPIPASLVNRGDSVVPAGLCAAPLRTPALKRWAIVTRSLRDNALAEFPKGISLVPREEQRSQNRKATQPSGRRFFLAPTSLLTPYRPRKGMRVARASSGPKILRRKRGRIYEMGYLAQTFRRQTANRYGSLSRQSVETAERPTGLEPPDISQRSGAAT